MNKALMVVAVATCAAASFSAPTDAGAASRAWVMSYVSNAVATSSAQMAATAKTSVTGAVTTATLANGALYSIEATTDAALCVESAAQAAEDSGVTNGTLFVWNGHGDYVCRTGRVVCTSTNMVYDGIGSRWTNGVVRFAGRFDCRGVRIQPSTSWAATNGIQGVVR